MVSGNFYWQKDGLDYHGKSDVHYTREKLDIKHFDLYPLKRMTNSMLIYRMKLGLFPKKALWTPASEGSWQCIIQLEIREVLPCDDAGSCVAAHGAYLWSSGLNSMCAHAT